MSYDIAATFGDSSDMPDRMSESEEKAAFIGRTRAARMARFEKQKPMLTILGLDQGTYKAIRNAHPASLAADPEVLRRDGRGDRMAAHW